MKKAFSAVCALVFLSACATPMPKEEAIPSYPVKPAASMVVGVVDHRPFILNDDKEEWFEGIIRSFVGFPMSLERPGPLEGKPFAFYLSTMLKESIEEAGGKADIVAVAKGTSHKAAVEALAKQRADTAILVMMYQSRIDFKVIKYEYDYRFEITILDRTGRVLVRKLFAGLDREIPLEKQFPFENMALTYKQTFNKILYDSEVKAALNAAR